MKNWKRDPSQEYGAGFCCDAPVAERRNAFQNRPAEQSKTNENETTGDLKKIGKMLNEEDRVDADWEMFAAHFDMAHSDFLAALKTQCPGLSPK